MTVLCKAQNQMYRSIGYAIPFIDIKPVFKVNANDTEMRYNLEASGYPLNWD